MSQTNIQQKASYYERVIADSKNSPLSLKYETMCTFLGELVTLSKKLNNPEIKMSPQIFGELKGKYQAVQKACKAYLSSKEFNSFEESRKGIVNNISKTLTKDMAMLEKCDPMEPGSLSEIISQSRSHTIHLKSSDIKTEGAALSKRIPLKTTSGKKGFFTPKTIYNVDKEWIEQIDNYLGRIGTEIKGLGKYEEIAKKRLERLKTDEKIIDVFCDWCPGCPMEEFLNMAIDKDQKTKMVRGVARMMGIPTEEYNKPGNNNLKEAVWKLIDNMANLVNRKGIMKVTGITKNSNISDRNCAMTDMAKLLGCSNILANSAPMTVFIDGKKVEGVFMETVDGTDLNRFKEDDEIFNADEDSFENGAEAMGQVADLQVLDYICGNTDRHMGNIIYQFEKDKNNKVVFKGIKGIDNDCSLGIPDIQKGKKIQNMVNPEDMQFIREDMLKKIVSLKKDTIDMQLSHYEITTEEKDAVWNRVEKVRQAVKEKKIRVIEKDHWKWNSFKRTQTERENYLKNIKDMSERCERKGYDIEERGDNDIKYVQDRRMANKVMYGKMPNIDLLRTRMKEAKSIIFDSGEYKMMKKPFDKIENLTKQIREKYNKPELIPEDVTAKLEDAYTELSEKAFKYIQLKKLAPSTTRGQKRLELAQNLLDFANDTLHESKSDPEKQAQAKEKEPMEKQEEELDVFGL